MTFVELLHIVAAVLLGAASLLILFRILRGPSILDRMIASDVLISAAVLVLGVEMVLNHHTRTLPVILALSGTALLGSIAVARYVSKQDRVEVVDPDGTDPLGVRSEGAR
jgi:multicomponent Na+:H+ antiporter subunit F